MQKLWKNIGFIYSTFWNFVNYLTDINMLWFCFVFFCMCLFCFVYLLLLFFFFWERLISRIFSFYVVYLVRFATLCYVDHFKAMFFDFDLFELSQCWRIGFTVQIHKGFFFRITKGSHKPESLIWFIFAFQLKVSFSIS